MLLSITSYYPAFKLTWTVQFIKSRLCARQCIGAGVISLSRLQIPVWIFQSSLGRSHKSYANTNVHREEVRWMLWMKEERKVRDIGVWVRSVFDVPKRNRFTWSYSGHCEGWVWSMSFQNVLLGLVTCKFWARRVRAVNSHCFKSDIKIFFFCLWHSLVSLKIWYD